MEYVLYYWVAVVSFFLIGSLCSFYWSYKTGVYNPQAPQYLLLGALLWPLALILYPVYLLTDDGEEK